MTHHARSWHAPPPAVRPRGRVGRPAPIPTAEPALPRAGPEAPSRAQVVQPDDGRARRRVSPAIVFFCAIAGGCRSDADRIRPEIERQVAAAAPAAVAVAYADLCSGAACAVDGDRVFHAASTMKIAVMIEAWRRAERGELDLDAPIEITNRFASAVDGAPFELKAEDDSETELYGLVGRSLPARELARRMIVRSSNLATNVLMLRLGVANVQRTAVEIGATRTSIVRVLMDMKAFDAGMSNRTTANDLARMLGWIAERADTPAGREMIEILAGQQLASMVRAGLPPGTRVASKTGEITGVLHDAAMVLDAGGRPEWILVILTEGFESPEEALAAGAEIARRCQALSTTAVED